jgi:hypothetical protein
MSQLVPNAPRPRARLLVFWDYDTQWGADRSRLGAGPQAWGPLEFEATDRLLDIHARLAVPACFAVVGSAACPGARPYHDPQQVRAIHAVGHEIASHAHRHEWLPGLTGDELQETLASSRDALEQCIGAPVHAFVPPFNQPFDHLPAGSISIRERLEAGRRHITLRRLCEALAATGYRFCRVAYRPLGQRAIEWLARRRVDRPVLPTAIADVLCLRLTGQAGFDAPVRAVLARAVARGGTVVAYGHPHSLHSGSAQDERHLVPFLETAARLRAEGRLDICQPRDLIAVAALGA